MSRVEVQGLCKQWGQTKALSEVSFSAEAGSFVVLLGPSGCGKSTLLRLVAGLETPSQGRVLIDGADVTGRDPARRGVSMVFQSYALFPHLSVAENIVFGLKVRRVPAPERARRLAQAAELVGLGDLLARKPAALSGGQRQRVALARAVVAETAVCLMDEPLSNLDARLRQEMRLELKALQRRLGMTVLYVTHDQTEAMSMADHVVLLNGGRLVQEGPPEELYAAPETPFAARFIGVPPMNLMPLSVEADGQVCLAGDVERRPLFAHSLPEGCRLGVRPEHLMLESADTPGQGILVVVDSEDYHGADTVVGVRPGPDLPDPPGPDTPPPIQVRLPGRVRLRRGEALRLRFAPADLHLFGPDGRRQDPLPRILPLATRPA
ncbi:ABC transporter ATP-binding protein [Roseospirillum parvum]|uniref:sn-glycerol 3-phosphate transport system ATP-binding protein n=1 Tax=Roseospirillum parvum TaxID=83401 RepID=A0A1G7TPI0_9PROT|nr:ABC transporter ATP-binding protein [Roseospirillum parvum]SDG37216.1 sn-glycerol 3-phosphate transport system ATP-binding protein [Roseospirillum parvum]